MKTTRLIIERYPRVSFRQTAGEKPSQPILERLAYVIRSQLAHIMSISPVVDEDPLTADAPPSYADAVEYLRRSKDGALRISPASARTTDRDGASQSTATPTAASTSERQPLLSSSPTTLEQHSPLSEHHVNSSSSRGYFAPLVQLKYWKALFHLLVLNFPFALAAWIVLFVGVLVGTSLLITLPLGQ